MMKLFGPRQWSGFREPVVVPPPVGAPCFECNRRIDADDFGIFLPFIDSNGIAAEIVVHRVCFLTELGIFDDPPSLQPK